MTTTETIFATRTIEKRSTDGTRRFDYRTRKTTHAEVCRVIEQGFYDENPNWVVEERIVDACPRGIESEYRDWTVRNYGATEVSAIVYCWDSLLDQSESLSPTFDQARAVVESGRRRVARKHQLNAIVKGIEDRLADGVGSLLRGVTTYRQAAQAEYEAALKAAKLWKAAKENRVADAKLEAIIAPIQSRHLARVDKARRVMARAAERIESLSA